MSLSDTKNPIFPNRFPNQFAMARMYVDANQTLYESAEVPQGMERCFPFFLSSQTPFECEVWIDPTPAHNSTLSNFCVESGTPAQGQPTGNNISSRKDLGFCPSASRDHFDLQFGFGFMRINELTLQCDTEG